MKTTYWLVVAAAVAVGGVIVYSRLSASDPPLPKVPLTTEMAQSDTPQLELPPVVLPPDEPSAVSSVPVTEGVPPPLPDLKSDANATQSIALASATEPVIPPVPVPVPPTVPVTQPLPIPVSPVAPVMPPLPMQGTAEPPVIPPGSGPVIPPGSGPVIPTDPGIPEPPIAPAAPPAPPVVPVEPPKVPVAPPVEPQMPTSPVSPTPPSLAPVSPTPAPSVPPPTMQLLPHPTTTVPTAPALATPEPVKPQSPAPAQALAIAGRFVVLKDNKLIQGNVSVSQDTVFVGQGTFVRNIPKSQVQFVAESKDEVYRFMLAKVPATAVAARLQVARWCMFNGMREQALVEAREIQKIPHNPRAPDEARLHNAAVDLTRSLELSFQQYPVETVAKMTAPAEPTFPTELAPVRPTPPAVLDPEPDVSPEAALVFGARVQPFLANRCTECHAKPDYAGKFKLVRVDPADAGPQATRTNLRAVAAQLRKEDPGASPLLWKSLSVHGGMKVPAIESRHAVVYQSLEAWTALAVGTPLTPPAPPPVPVAAPVPPVGDLPLPPPPPAYPPPVPVPAPSTPLVPPSPAPTIPPATDPILPAALPIPKAPVQPIPPADARVTPAPLSGIPSATAARPVSPVVSVGGTEFGIMTPPKLPATGPTGGDEFDPAAFNQQLPRK